MSYTIHYLRIHMWTTQRKILFANHRLDSIGGIETRLIDEFSYLKKNDYKIYVLVPKQKFNPEIGRLLPIDKTITLGLGDTSVAVEFINLVNQISFIIKDEDIHTLSIHMLDVFACAAIMAAQICRIPVISTIHGILDIYRTPVERILIQHLASKSFSLSISVSETFKSITPSISCKKTVIPNLINLNKYQHQFSDCKPAWLIINRISPEKFPSILRFLEAAEQCHINEVDIAGGGEKSKLEKLIKSLNLKVKVNFLGEVKDIARLIPQYSGVAGMGRVAIEGLACKKPVCIISIDGRLIGLVTTENFQYLKNYNFTGKGLTPIENERILRQLETHSSQDTENIYSLLEKELSVENWNNYIELYNNVTFIDNQAIESLYHKLSYFSTTLTIPFINDSFFQHLLYETLIEYDLYDTQKMWKYYETNLGMTNNYPSPYSNKSLKKRFKWWK